MFKAFIMGRLAADPTQREAGSSRCTELRVACETRMKDSNNPQGGLLTNFIRVSVWGTQGDNALKHFRKGYGIACTGDCAVRTYKGKDGNEYISVDLMNADFSFPPGKKTGDNTAQTSAPIRSEAPVPQPVDGVDDLLPF